MESLCFAKLPRRGVSPTAPKGEVTKAALKREATKAAPKKEPPRIIFLILSQEKRKSKFFCVP